VGFFGRLRGTKPGGTIPYSGDIDWSGVSTPYFLLAFFPDQPSAARTNIASVEPGKKGIVELYFDPVTLPASQSAAREYHGYFGPKEIERLEAFAQSGATSAIEAVDLGWSFVHP